jgi:arylsulfatase A-like enzyme
MQQRRKFLKTVGAGIAAQSFASSCGSGPGAPETEGKPNILLITSDQQRKDALGIYNPGHVGTKNLDALAADGVTFDRAYITSPTCTPSRASILTGQYPSRHGAYVIGTRLDPQSLKVTDFLGGNGYETYAVGKMHFQQVSTEGSFEGPPRKYDEGFWRNFDGPYYGFQHTQLLNQHSSEQQACRMAYGVWLKEHGVTEEDIARFFDNRRQCTWDLPRELHSSVFVSEKSVEFIQTHADQRSDQPFFMWTSFPDPHAPHVVQQSYDTIYNPDEMALKPYREGELDSKPAVYKTVFENGGRGHPNIKSAKEESQSYWRKKIAIHHGMMTLMDEEIGKIIQKLKQCGMYENTIIIFTSDHGDYLGNHGFWSKGFASYEEVFNVSCIVKNVGQKNSGARTNALFSLVDIAPTVLCAAGVKIPSDMQGVNQQSVLYGEETTARNHALIENREDQQGNFYQKIFVTDQYKIVYYHGQTDGELYDLHKDPDQYVNLWDDAAHSPIKQGLLDRMLNAYAENDGESADMNTTNLLAKLDTQIVDEGPRQARTSGS